MSKTKDSHDEPHKAGIKFNSEFHSGIGPGDAENNLYETISKSRKTQFFKRGGVVLARPFLCWENIYVEICPKILENIKILENYRYS